MSWLGGNGFGKTALVNTLTGMIRPLSGSAQFEGVECAGQTADRMVRSGIVQVSQGREVWPNMTVLDNLELGAVTRRERAALKDDIAGIFELFPTLVRRRQQLAGSLRGGEQQMLAIGRALMARPRCLLLDEPSAGLAPTVVAQMVETILIMNRRGMTILLVEQNIGVAAAVAEQAHVLKNGEIASSGPAAGLLDNPVVLAPISGDDVGPSQFSAASLARPPPAPAAHSCRQPGTNRRSRSRS